MSFEKVKRAYSEITNVFNNPIVKKSIKYGSAIAGAYADFAEKPSWWTALKSGAGLLKDFADDQEIWAWDYFDDDGTWTDPFDYNLNGAFYRVLSKLPYRTIKTSTDNIIIRLHEIEEITLGYALNTKLGKGKVDRICCRVGQEIKSRAIMKSLLWKSYGNKSLVMRKSNGNFNDENNDKIIFEIDEAHESMHSVRATEYAGYLQKCINADVHRSVMFYGPPGTGKSTTAKTIIEKLGLRSFRIRVADLSGIDNSTLYESIKIFQPEAIIFDDFDRSHNQENLLEVLEHFHDTVKLVIATVNRRDSLDEALLRPGRFDELVLVKHMDADVVRKVLGADNDEVFEIVKTWPIAFIQEYVKRTRFMSKLEAISSIEQLAPRVNRLSEFDEDSEIAQVLKKSNKYNDHNEVAEPESKKNSRNGSAEHDRAARELNNRHQYLIKLTEGEYPRISPLLEDAVAGRAAGAAQPDLRGALKAIFLRNKRNKKKENKNFKTLRRTKKSRFRK